MQQFEINIEILSIKGVRTCTDNMMQLASACVC